MGFCERRFSPPWGQCELTYWTGFHANPTLRSAADLATYYPNRRAQEAEEFLYGQCTTAAAAREYQRIRYRSYYR